jgi:serine/threonine protein kinase
MQGQNKVRSNSALFNKRKVGALSLQTSGISVSIPDPFLSQISVGECLFSKQRMKLCKGIRVKSREEIVIEIVDNFSNAEEKLTYFNRLDILREIDHPSIPKLIDFYDSDNINRIVFEQAKGRTLADLVSKKGKMPPHVLSSSHTTLLMFLIISLRQLQILPNLLLGLFRCVFPLQIFCPQD